jgi:hypothetical protein
MSMKVETSWNIYRTRFLVRACQLSEPLTFTDSLGREHAGEPGDYLVETYPGIRRITSQKLFEDIYVPLSSPESEARECSPPSAIASSVNPAHTGNRPLGAIA